MLSPRCLGFILLSCFCLFVSKGHGQSPVVVQRPNILWITTEDISPHLGCYGDVYARTPNLDKLAREGVVYQHAFATAPVCAVARSSLITGVYASSLGSQHMRTRATLPPHIRTYPEWLRQAGYFCTNRVKTDFNLEMDDQAVWDVCTGDAHWRDRPDPSQPFFSIFNFTTTHESRVNEGARYAEAVAGVPDDLLREPGEVPLPPYYPDTAPVRVLWARYYNIITAMDRQVGEILSQLEADGLKENTVIFFYSDHGAGIPRHKRWLFDSGLQVPLIVYVPPKYRDWVAHPPGSYSQELVSFIDMAPTALHMAGVAVPAYMEGRPFVGPHLSEERTYVFGGRDRMDERYDMQRAVRNKRYKYIRYYEPYKPYCQYMNTPEKGEIMQSIREAGENETMPLAGRHVLAPEKPHEALYDVLTDPFELHNLAEDPAYGKMLDALRAAHSRWSDSTYDTGLIPEPIIHTWETRYGKSIYEIMREESIPVRLIRETALGEAPLDTLFGRLNHTNAAVRYWAAVQLGNQAGTWKDSEALAACTKDSEPTVAVASARALGLAGNPEAALPGLEAGLDHPQEWVRLQAAQVLDELGEQARPSIPVMEAHMDDPNKYVVRILNHALNHLKGTDRVVR